MSRTLRYAAAVAALVAGLAASPGWTAGVADYRGGAARLVPSARTVGFVTRSSIASARATEPRHIRSGATATYWRAPGGRIVADAVVYVFDSPSAARATFRRTFPRLAARRTAEGGLIRISIVPRRRSHVSAVSVIRNVLISSSSDGYTPNAEKGGGRADALRLHRAIQRKVVSLSR